MGFVSHVSNYQHLVGGRMRQEDHYDLDADDHYDLEANLGNRIQDQCRHRERNCLTR